MGTQKPVDPVPKSEQSQHDEPTSSDGRSEAGKSRQCLGQKKSSDQKTAVAESGGADTEEKKDGGFKYFLRVFTYNDRQGWIMNGIALVAMIASGTLLPIMDIIFGKFINVFNDFIVGKSTPSEYRSEVAKYSLYFVYLFIGRFVLTYIWTVLVSISAIRTTKALRVDFVRQTLRQEISFFDSPATSVASQITTNGNLINTGISERLGNTIQGLSSFVTAFIVAFAAQWKLTLIILCIVPVNLVVTFICSAIDEGYEHSIFNIYARSSTLADEAFSTIRTAHAFWAFPKLSKRFTDTLEEARRVGAKKSPVLAVLFATEFFLIYAGYALAFWQGIRMYTSGEVAQPGTVVTVIFAMIVAATALTQIAPQIITITKAVAASQQLFETIDRQSKIDSLSQEGDTIADFQGDIRFRGVSFAYPTRPDVPVLRSLDVDISADQTTALVGASGSGKSTIVGLLERWYTLNEGSITLDGRTIESLNLRWLRTNIRLVQQEPTLFSGTIFQNIVDGLANTDMAGVSDEEKRALVIESCKAAYAHDFIEGLPNGYETYIGERGASLSGGQKQRIVIARSIICNPKVLILDEATSALDPNAEKIVQKALNNVAKGRTMIVISHRLSTIRDADNIVVMAKGNTIEQGTHEQLIRHGGAYSRLVKAQDLGQGPAASDDLGDVDDKEPEVTDVTDVLSRTSTRASQHAASSERISYGLLKCIYLILREQRPLWLPVGSLLLMSVVGGGTYPASAVLFSKTMTAFESLDSSKGNLYALMFLMLALVNFVLYAMAGWLTNIVSQYIAKTYRAEIFNNTLRQDASFFDNPEHGSGALVARLSAEPTSLQELMSMNIALMMVSVVNLLSSAILAIAVGWKLGLALSLGALPVLAGSGYFRIRLEFKFEEDTAGRFAKSGGLASEAVMGVRTVSSLALEDVVIERYRASLEDLAKSSIGNLAWKMLFYSLSQAVSFLAMALGFWYGGQLVSRGEYTTEQFYTIFTAIIFSGEAAALFFQFSTSITKARSAINYLLDLRRGVTLHDTEGPEDGQAPLGDKSQVSEKGPDVECDRLGFAYPLRPKIPVLRGIDVKVRPGNMVAFVGASGCGKSTMIALLERFYDPKTGTIRQDGQDIKAMDRRLYRRDIALVQQEPVLYQGSIRDNIALGIEDSEPSDEDVIAACRQANIYDFVASLPDGLHTPCGKQGLSLSGGQRQRIAIARALIRRPRLLLLDEATSALDTESEKVVKQALDRAAQGRTTIAVAHRLSTIRDADAIAVFAGGRIAEMGTHAELVARRGLYYEMVLGQSLDRET